MYLEKPVRPPVSAVVIECARAFSLVEVVLAIGIVSFSMLAIVGTLSVGLGTMKSATAVQFEGAIAERLRSDLQELSPATIQDLDGQTRYYSHEGREVGPGPDAYFALALKVVKPVVPGPPPAGLESGLKNVTATLEFPLSAPSANREKRVFSLLAAAQGGA